MLADFVNTSRPKEELRVALDVLREFKECESEVEWLVNPFLTWARLEQLERMLAHLVEGTPLNSTTDEES